MVAALVGRSFPFLSIRADSIDVHTTHRERERAKPPKDTRDRKKERRRDAVRRGPFVFHVDCFILFCIHRVFGRSQYSSSSSTTLAVLIYARLLRTRAKVVSFSHADHTEQDSLASARPSRRHPFSGQQMMPLFLFPLSLGTDKE